MNSGQRYYHIGGTLAENDPSYVERKADTDFYEKLKEGKFCYVFNSRQMGKSSLQVRVQKKLERENYRCVLISLDGVGTQVTEEQWYYTFIQSIADEFDELYEFVTQQLSTWWQEQKSLTNLERVKKFFTDILLTKTAQRIVIFIDEIDTVLSLNFPTDDFFAFIRYCYNQRATNPQYEQITFALLGVATPSQLIKDKQRTPFNIGEAIQLNGFSFAEAQPLARGLEAKIGDIQIAEYILREVLKWTGGQPFLTQKICQLIVDSKNSIPNNQKDLSQWLEQLIKSKIIDNWEAQDNPQHLKTIRDRITNNSNRKNIENILTLYLEILENKELTASNLQGEKELILAGLVLKVQPNTLKIYNRIYESVFDSNWIAEVLAQQQPYKTEINTWLTSKRQDKSKLLRGKKLREALSWSHGKKLKIEDYQFLNASQEVEINNYQNYKYRVINALGYSLLLIVFSVVVGQLAQRTISLFLPYVLEPHLFSQGEKTFFLGTGNKFQNDGVAAFREKNYVAASRIFQEARRIDKNDPEPTIYYNNAKAHEKGNYLTLAVAVPINARREVAQEVLRGVAQAQHKINQNDGIKGQLLNIVIADDNNDSDQGRRVAQEFIKDPRILGVIGHNGSSVSLAAVEKYQSAKLPMISPTSSSTQLSQKKFPVFFRTVTNDEKNGQILAEYAIKNGMKKVSIFYRREDAYSESLKQVFEDEFQKEDRQVVDTVDLGNPGISENATAQVINVAEKEADAAVFFPNVEAISTVIGLAKAIEESNVLKQLKKFDMLGGDALYSADTLRRGGTAVEGLVLAIPWFAEQNESQEFAKRACETWGGGVSWRTAASYDATKAFIQAISQSENPSRASVLENLKSVKLSAKETSRHERTFENGERKDTKPVLVRVERNPPGRATDNCAGLEAGGFRFRKVKQETAE